MATNITVNTLPQAWSSAYDDIELIFDFDAIDITGTTNPSGTTTRVTVATAFAITPPVGTYCYIDSGAHAGLWRVLAATSTTVDLTAPYDSNQTTGTLKSLRAPVFTLFKGFKVDENFPTQLPYLEVASFTNSFNSDYQLVINLKGLLQRIFTIEPPDITTDFDYSVFNAYRLVWDTDNETDIRYVLNSSISTDELNSNYLSGSSYLTNTDQPLLWGCGVSFMTIFDGGFPKLEVFNGGEQVVAGFSSAFQSDQFNQGYDI